MRRSWKFTILFAVSYWLFAVPVYALPEVKTTFPRLANYFLHWTISDEEARELARFDIVILDAEVQERSRPQLQKLRELNPKLILLAYVPASEIRRDVGSLREIAPLRYRMGSAAPEAWYLKDAAGGRRSFWPGTWIVDVTDGAPRSETSYGLLRWNEYLPKFVASEILATGLWDGVFYDNAWDNIVHFARGTPDIDRDGTTDNPDGARARWQDGVRAIYRQTAALNPDKFVFENDGPMYAPEVHGVLLESFPRKGWTRHREELKRVRGEGKDPAVAILNANTFNSGRRDDFRAMRFGLTTALLSDAFFSFDFGDQDHGQTWRYDEYEVFLGEPAQNSLTQKFQSGKPIWIRNFENGIVLVNPNDAPRAVTLPIEVEKVRGIQDTSVNDGRITREFVVGALDGLIVLRPLTTVTGAPFENGVFARIFNMEGEPVRAGFFAFDRSERSGALLASVDIDGDEKVEKVKMAEKGKMEIVFGDGRLRRLNLQLAGDSISLAIGDLTRDGVKEIVVAGGGQVIVLRADGTAVRVPFFPFGPRYRGAVSVGVGDLNGDGFSEIVVGAGEGGGPQVRIFSGEGKLLGGGFFAYDPRFRGGVRIAVGDLDGDGRAEIVTGPGVGGGPQIRIFDGRGRALGSGFFAFDRASRAGVIPLVADSDGDGRNEILAVTKEIL